MASASAIFSVVGAVAAVGGTAASIASTNAQRKAQKKEGKIQRRVAEIENVRQARRAVAQRRVQQANLIAQSQVSNQTGSNSAVQGAVGSLSTQTAANIGASNTRLAGDLARFHVLSQGARTAGRFNNIAAGFGGLGNLAENKGLAQLIQDRFGGSNTG